MMQLHYNLKRKDKRGHVVMMFKTHLGALEKLEGWNGGGYDQFALYICMKFLKIKKLKQKLVYNKKSI